MAVAPPAENLRTYLTDHRIEHVKIGVFDTDGILRGKYLSRDKFLSALDKHLGFCDVILGWDSNDQLYDNTKFTGWHTAYPDATVRVLPATRREIPFEPKTALFLGEFAGRAELVCPRATLRRVLENASPANMIEIIETYKATICFTAPTAYRAMLAAMDNGADLSSLRIAVSAGETLPPPVFEDWTRKTGKPILDGIGTTELLHIFITNRIGDACAGATGRPVSGYEAKIVDAHMNEVAPGTVGRLAVRGPTGCRYLADARQKSYVRDGWNLTGDAFLRDAEGRFHFAARADDMIVSAGYNIAGPEVEAALLSHPDVSECAVVGAPDTERGEIVAAYVVLKPSVIGDPLCVKRLQDHVKAVIAPYKYPRSVSFVGALPKTQTGKIQRFKLRQQS